MSVYTVEGSGRYWSVVAAGVAVASTDSEAGAQAIRIRLRWERHGILDAPADPGPIVIARQPTPLAVAA